MAVAAAFFFSVSLANAVTELVTVPAGATVDVVEENYARARGDAVNRAFTEAVKKAVTGLVPPDALGKKAEVVNERIISRSADFVKSYKFLEETSDPVKGKLTVRLQVTLFLNDIRIEAKALGLATKRRDLPRLLILIDERNMGFFTGENFLLLKSVSEEALTQNFRDKGFQVADRKHVREILQEQTAIEAIKGDLSATEKIGEALNADMLIFGRTEIKSSPTTGGELVEAVINIDLLLAADGEKIASLTKFESGIYGDVLAGTLDAIGSASRQVARSLLLTVRLKWKEIRSGRHE